MKVCPDEAKIPSGYLYAYLSGKFGVPLVVGGTYGAIIQHIEPRHIADLPVPRLGDKVERKAHELVEDAAQARTAAATLLAEAQGRLLTALHMLCPRPIYEYHSPFTGAVSASLLQNRCDAFYYCSSNEDARSAFNTPRVDFRTLGEVAEVFIPGIFKRLYVDDPRYGYPYITGADVFQLESKSDEYLMRRVAIDNSLVLRKGMIVIQEAGQLGGLIGRSVLVGDCLDGFACTNNMVRVTPHDHGDTGFLYALLANNFGVRLVAREAAGSSIPHLETSRIKSLQLPWPSKTTRQEIGEPVTNAYALRDRACSLDHTARALVERAIEEMS
jgi:type I restriction enzyme S subunit